MPEWDLFGVKPMKARTNCILISHGQSYKWHFRWRGMKVYEYNVLIFFVYLYGIFIFKFLHDIYFIIV